MTIVLPENAPPVKVERIKRAGAALLFHGAHYGESEEKAIELDRQGPVLIHPFDDPRVVAGQGTIALELHEDAPKELGMMAMQYGNVYVARCAMGAKDSQVVKAMQEAESYPGTSLLIVYSHCIGHGFDLSCGMEQQKKLVGSGLWTLFRYDPRRTDEGKAPLQLDSSAPKLTTADFMRNETRFRMVEKVDPKRFAELAERAQESAKHRWSLLKQMAEISFPAEDASDGNGAGTNGNG